MEQKVVFSGIQPTGTLTIGNYFGAIHQFLKLQENQEYNNLFCIVDLHALSSQKKITPNEMKRNILNLAKFYLAAGLDPQKCIIFQQSMVPAHSELFWILNNYINVGYLERMTQYKDKIKKPNQEINTTSAALLNYPVLMAADILLYNTSIVPVGLDQKQHLELTRTIAHNFGLRNKKFNHFQIKILEHGAKIYSLTEPTLKMSKSGSEKSYIALNDSPEVVIKKLKSATTDSIGKIQFDRENQPGISNLLTIISLIDNTSVDKTALKYTDYSYGEFKLIVADKINEFLAPLQEKFANITDNEAINILNEGSEKANQIAQNNLKAIKKSLGLMLGDE